MKVCQSQQEVQKLGITAMDMPESLGCLYCKYIIEDILHREMTEKDI
jgi:hypothetical protein